jgi:signal transduction histidine kinase
VQQLEQDVMRSLAGVRARFARARTADEVFEALADGLIPVWADGVAAWRCDADRPLWSAGAPRHDLPPGTADLFGRSAPVALWLYREPSAAGADAAWCAVDPGAARGELPGRVVAVPVDTMGEIDVVTVDRDPSRGEWAPAELWVVNECVRLAEFTLAAVEQRRRVLEARAAADAAAHRWAAFARLSNRLALSIELDNVASAIMMAVVPYLADWALLDVVTPQRRVERIASRHVRPEGKTLLKRINQFPFGSSQPLAAIEALGDRGWLLGRVTDDELRALSARDQHGGVSELAPHSIAVVPLMAGQQLIGALTLGTSESGQEYEPDDLPWFNGMAHQAALALRGARLFRDAERARREREEVLAIVSHDLKNPLNVLGFSVAILGSEGIPPEKKAAQLEIMRRTLGQMDELVQNVLDAARIEAQRFSISPAPQEVDGLVEEALQRVTPIAEQAAVRLEHGGARDLPRVMADRSRIMQVFTNLLVNAISFTPAQGSVWIRAAAEEDVVRFEIEDSGPGLDPESAERVFDRFWQARDSGRAGAGLGLAIARGLVEAHRGEIGVRVEAGKGAVFHFTLPLEDPGVADPQLPDGQGH